MRPIGKKVLTTVNGYFSRLALAATACLFGASGAMADAITLGSAAGYDSGSGPVVGYDLLVGNQAVVSLGSGSGGYFTANDGAIAIGTYAKGGSSNPDSFHSVTSGGFYEGRYGSSCTPTGGTCNHQYTTSGSVGTIVNSAALFNPSGSGIANNSPIEAALAAVNQIELDAHAAYTGYDGTGTYNAQSKGGFVCTTGSTCTTGSYANLTLEATTSLADNIFDFTTLDLENGACLSFNEGSSGGGAKFVVNITGALTLKNNACISLGAGVSAKDVIFNLEGGSPVNISSAGALSGTILAASSNVTFNHSTLTGQLIAGFGAYVSGGSTSYTLSATKSTINYAAFTSAGRVPEPASVALFGTGLAAVAACRKRRSAKRRT